MRRGSDKVYNDHVSLIKSGSTLLFKLDKNPETYAHLLKKKDLENIVPIVNYLIGDTSNSVFLTGDVVTNYYIHGLKKRYKILSILAVMKSYDADNYTGIMNNIISSSDGAFSLVMKYRVRKYRKGGQFKDIAHSYYFIEPRLTGLENILYLFRPSTIELCITTHKNLKDVFGIETN